MVEKNNTFAGRLLCGVIEILRCTRNDVLVLRFWYVVCRIALAMKSFEPSAVLRTCCLPQDFNKLSRGAALEAATRRKQPELAYRRFNKPMY